MGKKYISVLWGVLFGFVLSSTAFAQEGPDDLAENIVNGTSGLPGLIAALCYLFGIVLVITGLLKIKDYVENEQKTPLKTGVIRLLVAGALFALPLIIEVVKTTLNGGDVSNFDISGGVANDIGMVLGDLAALISFGTNASAILLNIGLATDELPALVAAVAYLLGVLLAAIGVLKIREHVEEPERVTLKEPVIRLLIAGALFALPNIFEAMYVTIAGGGMGFWGTTLSLLNGANFLFSSQDSLLGLPTPPCDTEFLGLGDGGLGSVICTSWISSAMLPTFLAALSYVLGLIFGVWGLVKIRDHVLSPTQTKLSEGIMRLIAGGAFFAMPVVAIALQSSVTPIFLTGAGLFANTGFTEDPLMACGTNNSLDEAMVCFMRDVLGPAQVSLNFFSFAAGLIFVMIGISRLIKSAQEGPKGPGGLGTVATFVIAGILMSGTTMIQAVSASLFGSTQAETLAVMTYTVGMSADEMMAAQNVISAVLKFMIMIGLFSFIRGIFIMRDAAEGKQQASVMSGMTHILGGALAVNLGPLLNAVQTTLGITAFGVIFS